MKKATDITCAFLDIGGVVLSNGWDRNARKRTATNFKLELGEMEDRHHLTFDTYEEGKPTLEEYLDHKESSMKPGNARILTINGGSSSTSLRCSRPVTRSGGFWRAAFSGLGCRQLRSWRKA